MREPSAGQIFRPSHRTTLIALVLCAITVGEVRAQAPLDTPPRLAQATGDAPAIDTTLPAASSVDPDAFPPRLSIPADPEGDGERLTPDPAGAANTLDAATRQMIDPGAPLEGAPVYSLPELLARARNESPVLAVSRSEELAAQAGLRTARAYPNPEVEFSPGRYSSREGFGSGSASQVTLSQPLENPWLRDARQKTAESRIEVAGANTRVTRTNLDALVKRRFFDMLRLTEEVKASTEDLQLTEQIRERVLLRAQTGEAPRFDLIRAESEVAVARKNLTTSLLQLRQAAADLRQVVSPTMARQFEISYPTGFYTPLTDTQYEERREHLLERNPEILAARRETALAESRVGLERQSVLPQVTLRAARDRDPTSSTTRIGAQVSIPLLNRREGPIAEARAQLERSRFALSQREFETVTGFDAAWFAYLAARNQTQALENGILARARSVLEIAEAAYRLGERGILEYLDAQRQFRLIRNELIQARYTLLSARAELDRLSDQND